jgi:hypothetical protein
LRLSFLFGALSTVALTVDFAVSLLVSVAE